MTSSLHSSHDESALPQMRQSVQNQLYDLFGNVYRILHDKEDAQAGIESALDVIVRELHQESSHRRSETISEMKGVEKMLDGFDPDRSPAIEGISRHFGLLPSRPELFSIAECLRDMQPTIMTPLTRMHRRRKMALLKWFDANWSVIQPLLCRIEYDF
jgi:hypothetical protein